MTDYMKEAERLSRVLEEIAQTALRGVDNEQIRGHLMDASALLTHIQRGAVPEGVGAFRHKETGQVRYTLIGGEHDEDEWEDVLIVPMLAAAPDQFRDAAKMMAEPAEAPMPEPDLWLKQTSSAANPPHGWAVLFTPNGDASPAYLSSSMNIYGAAREAAGYARGLAEGAARTGLTPAEHDVLAERERQISAEGWTPEHDDEHDKRELSRASLCYVQQYVGRFWLVEDYEDGLSRYQSDEAPDEWPWDEDWWKPTAPRRDLVKAAALLHAEIERLDRAALRGKVE